MGEHYLRLLQSAKSSVEHEDQDRQALAVFPLQLRLRLLAESRTPILKWHPVFAYLHNFHLTLFANISTDVIFWHAYQPEDDIFINGTSSIGAYYIAHGDFVF